MSGGALAALLATIATAVATVVVSWWHARYEMRALVDADEDATKRPDPTP